MFVIIAELLRRSNTARGEVLLSGGIIFVLALLLICALERIRALQFRTLALLRPYLLDDAAYLLTSIVIGIAVSNGARSGPFAWISWRAPFATWAHNTAGRWALVPIALFLMDGVNYAAHWSMHRADALWAFHKIHHSSRALDWMASFRAHIVDQVFRAVATTLSLMLIGIPLPSVALGSALWVAWSMFTHANLSIDLRWLEPVLVTPRLHRIHHVPEFSCDNLGTVFTLWDRLRGTLVHRDTTRDAPLGVPGEVDTYPQRLPAQTIAGFRDLFVR
jgi:sterol desaturase/sphingolipid hydroxylase (fatty acid hydroxylase superfamily)